MNTAASALPGAATAGRKRGVWLVYAIASAGIGINIFYFFAEFEASSGQFYQFWSDPAKHVIVISLAAIFPVLAYLLNCVLIENRRGDRSQVLEMEMEERTRDLEDLKSFSESVMASVNDMVFVIGSDGRFQFISGNSRKVLGFEPQELEGRQFVDQIAAGSVAVAVGNFEKIMWGDKVPPYEVEMTDASGGVRCIEISSTPYRNHERVIAQVGVAREVSERKQLEHYFNERKRELAALSAVAGAAGKSLDQDHILSGTLEQVLSLFLAEHAWVCLCEGEDQRPALKAWKGEDAGSEMARRAMTLRLGEVFSSTVAGEKKSVCQNVDDLEPEFAEPLKKLGLESLAAVPMISGGRLMGVLGVAGVECNQFSRPDINLLQVAASQIVMSLENARLREELKYAGLAPKAQIG